MMDGLMLGADRDLVAVWQKMNAKRFDNIMLGTRTSKEEASKEGLKVSFDQKSIRSEEHTSELQSRLHLVCRLLLEKKKMSPVSGGERGADGAGLAGVRAQNDFGVEHIAPDEVHLRLDHGHVAVGAHLQDEPACGSP